MDGNDLSIVLSRLMPVIFLLDNPKALPY